MSSVRSWKLFFMHITVVFDRDSLQTIKHIEPHLLTHTPDSALLPNRRRVFQPVFFASLRWPNPWRLAALAVVAVVVV